MSARTYLFVPADRADRLRSALDRGADALIADLEDGVQVDRKPEALRHIVEWLGSVESPKPELWVRVNAGERMAEELEAIVGPNLSGVCVPKVDKASDLSVVIERLDRYEVDRGLALGSIGLIPLIETPGGVLDARSIAATPRVRTLAMGEEDLCAEMSVDPDVTGAQLATARSLVVLGATASGCEPPIAGVQTAIHDLDQLAATTEALRRLGFGGRLVVHPNQIATVNAVMTPSEEAVSYALRVLRAFDEALAVGRGAIDLDGKLIDEPVAIRARRLLDRANR